jgi:sugar lactone lactonase YvrE
VRQIYDTTVLGSPDPSGLAYVPGMGLFLCDSEVNESPFYSTTNLFLLQPNGNQLTLLDSYNHTGFTIVPTGLTYAPSTDPSKNRLYISEDDANRVFWVDPDASLNSPKVKLGEFRTSLSGQTDAEDVAFDLMDGDVNGGDGHLYISNGINANIREVNTDGTLVRTISLPSAIPDPDALLWDDVHNVFFVGMRSSSNIWVLDRNGTLVDTITVLANHPRPGGSKARVCDLEFAPSSDPNDGDQMSLDVADYGGDQKNDGRLFEIDFSDYLWA